MSPRTEDVVVSTRRRDAISVSGDDRVRFSWERVASSRVSDMAHLASVLCRMCLMTSSASGGWVGPLKWLTVDHPSGGERCFMACFSFRIRSVRTCSCRSQGGVGCSVRSPPIAPTASATATVLHLNDRVVRRISVAQKALLSNNVARRGGPAVDHCSRRNFLSERESLTARPLGDFHHLASGWSEPCAYL